MRNNSHSETTGVDTLWQKAGLANFAELTGPEPYQEERQRLRFEMAGFKGWTAWRLKEYDQALAAFSSGVDSPAQFHSAKLRPWLLLHLLERRPDYAQAPANGGAPDYTLVPVDGNPAALEERKLAIPLISEDASRKTQQHGVGYNATTLAYLRLLHRLLLFEPQMFDRAGPVYFAYHAVIETHTGMVLLPMAPGTFLMGSPESEAGRYENEGPQHSVTLSRAFWVGKYPVTQAEYEKMMGTNPSHFKGERRPVEKVSWDEAVDFCRRLTEQAHSKGSLPTGYEFRLPTEAEWEYCCRAGSNGAYCFGDNEERLADYAWYNKNSQNETSEVGLKQANAWGLHDMHGNVWEWCLDKGLTGYDRKENVVDPLSASGQSRVIRGGGWCSPCGYCRSAYRGAFEPSLRNGSLGFRVCLAPIPAGEPMTESGTVAPKAEPGAGDREPSWAGPIGTWSKNQSLESQQNSRRPSWIGRVGRWLKTRIGKKP